MEFLTEEIEEIIEGQSFVLENQEYDLFILKLKNNKYIVYFNITNLETNEIAFNTMKEFENVELAKKEFEIYDFKNKEKGK